MHNAFAFSIRDRNTSHHTIIFFYIKDFRYRFTDINIVKRQLFLDSMGFSPPYGQRKKSGVTLDELANLVVRQEINQVRIRKQVVSHEKVGQSSILGLEQINNRNQLRFRVFTVHYGLTGLFGKGYGG